LAYFHYKKRNPLNTQVEQFQAWFWKACLSNRFGSSVVSHIEEDCEAFDKILEGEKADFPYQIDWETFKVADSGQAGVQFNVAQQPVFETRRQGVV
jgi:hypothetical protein